MYIDSKLASFGCSLRLGSACWSSLSWAAFLRRRLGASDVSLAVDAGGGGGCSRWPDTVTATGLLQGLWPAPLTPTLRTFTCNCVTVCEATSASEWAWTRQPACMYGGGSSHLMLAKITTSQSTCMHGMAQSHVVPVQSVDTHLICQPRLHICDLLLCCLAGRFAVDAVRRARLGEGSGLNLMAGRLCMGAVCFWQCPTQAQRWRPADRCRIGHDRDSLAGLQQLPCNPLLQAYTGNL